MPTLSTDAKALLQFACNRQTVTLFKELLKLLEQLAEEHDEAFEKLAKALPKEYQAYIGLADYFTVDKSDRLRREVLQRGNDCARAIRDEISKYYIDFPVNQEQEQVKVGEEGQHTP